MDKKTATNSKSRAMFAEQVFRTIHAGKHKKSEAF